MRNQAANLLEFIYLITIKYKADNILPFILLLLLSSFTFNLKYRHNV